VRVLIVGGGIGGLTTALSLHAVGITDVTVIESVDEIFRSASESTSFPMQYVNSANLA
jgi:thioredoxin reductase